jgi:hypothetical protein
MDRTIGALREILLRLFQEQAREWSPRRRRRRVSPKAQDVWDELSQNWWQPLEEKELEKLLKVADELHLEFSKNKVFYLPPLEKGDAEFVPALSMKCDIKDNASDLELRVMLVRRDESNGKLQGIGFRLESPEGKGEGRHDFYHAQLIKGFRNGKDVESIPWLPDSQPSFPILARNPITMVLALLITLYGKNYCWEFYTTHSLHRADIKRYMEELNEWINWPAFS